MRRSKQALAAVLYIHGAADVTTVPASRLSSRLEAIAVTRKTPARASLGAGAPLRLPPGWALLSEADRLALDYLALRLLRRGGRAPVNAPTVTIRRTPSGAELAIFGVLSVPLTRDQVLEFGKQFIDVYQVLGDKSRPAK